VGVQPRTSRWVRAAPRGQAAGGDQPLPHRGGDIAAGGVDPGLPLGHVEAGLAHAGASAVALHALLGAVTSLDDAAPHARRVCPASGVDQDADFFARTVNAIHPPASAVVSAPCQSPRRRTSGGSAFCAAADMSTTHADPFPAASTSRREKDQRSSAPAGRSLTRPKGVAAPWG